MNPYTYTGGMYLTAIKQITKRDIIALCKELNSINIDSGTTFQPESITEGGIVYKFPNSIHGEYKTIRMYFNCPLIKYNRDFIQVKHSLMFCKTMKKKNELLKLIDKTNFHWPIIPDNVMELWENNDDVILERGLSIHTYLKAFSGAPVFTTDELKIFGTCSEKIGLKVDSKYPKNKDLISYNGTLGNYRK
jgi:hypothetical protein